MGNPSEDVASPLCPLNPRQQVMMTCYVGLPILGSPRMVSFSLKPAYAIFMATNGYLPTPNPLFDKIW